MKKIYLSILTIAAVFLTGCGNNWLDLNPTNKALAGQKLSLLEAEASANGLYDVVRDYQYYGARMLYYADVRGDDMQANGTTKRTANAYAYRFTRESAPSSWWAYSYKVIRNANNILRAIDDIEVSTDAEKKRRDHAKGQALTLRALAYFDICRVYGYPYIKDGGASWGACIIPVEWEHPENEKPRRSTVKQTYEEVIIPDLLEAIPLLRENRRDALGQVTQLTAKTLLSRVYLYCQKWPEAFDMAEQVIKEHDAKGFTLWTTEEYKGTEIWKSHNRSESLMELIFSSDDAQKNDGIAYLAYDQGYDDMCLTNSFVEAWDPADARRNSFKASTKDSNVPPKSDVQRHFTIKYSAPSSNVREGSIIVMRISEAYLNAAEASIFIDNGASGLPYYNTIRTRAGLPAKGSITLDDVLEERRFEFYAEGHRAFDLLRHDKTIHRTGDGHLMTIEAINNNVDIDLNNYMILMPIPRAEINANENIRDQQNPGWGSGY